MSDNTTFTELAECPFTELEKWYESAKTSEKIFPNAMTLATVDAHACPHARIVLMKKLSKEGIVFFTNYESQKGHDITDNPNVALVFYWPSLLKQVRVEGLVERTDDKVSDDYFASRVRGSQLGARISLQSQPIISREQLLADYENSKQLFADKNIPRPEYWGGYCVKPYQFEFWQAGEHRLHDRIRYYLHDNEWVQQRLAP
jgi:pyridoxamine 5'-phosphate oxidase